MPTGTAGAHIVDTLKNLPTVIRRWRWDALVGGRWNMGSYGILFCSPVLNRPWLYQSPGSEDQRSGLYALVDWILTVSMLFLQPWTSSHDDMSLEDQQCMECRVTSSHNTAILAGLPFGRGGWEAGWEDINIFGLSLSCTVGKRREI